MVLKEQTATYTKSVFLPANASTLGDCGVANDLSWVTEPTNQTPIGKSVRAKSVANYKITTQDGDFCAVINTDIETADTSQWLTPPNPNFMTIAGHSKACGTPSQKVVERVVELYF
jgi:hypothetical protein